MMKQFAERWRGDGGIKTAVAVQKAGHSRLAMVFTGSADFSGSVEDRR